MLVLLPPSETKRDGGAGAVLDVDSLAFPALSARRHELVAAVIALAEDPPASMSALGLGPTQAFEVERNRTLRATPTMPALDRYTGVLYDALAASSLDADARAFAEDHVLVHSALFGLVRSLDLLPAYRLSHSSRLPGLPLKKHWRQAIGEVLATVHGPILDLRSEAYAALGPAPIGAATRYLRVVAEDGDGHKRALNHFNKKSKGLFTRAFLADRPDIRSVDDLRDWAADAGFRLLHGAHGELQLVVTEAAAQPA